MLSPQAVARVQFSILCSLFLAQPGAGSVILPTNTTAVELVSFVPQDSNRDTLSLVISCLLTLSLCVYTAVHLNVPLKHEPAWQTRLREAKWCMIGLLGPELVLFAAWRQWNSAKALTEIVEQVLKDEKASGNASSKVCTYSVYFLSQSCAGCLSRDFQLAWAGLSAVFVYLRPSRAVVGLCWHSVSHVYTNRQFRCSSRT